MDLKKLSQSATPKKLGSYVARKKVSGHHGHGAKRFIETVREVEHNGHQIVIRTTYKVEVDGKAIRAPLGVDDSGQVHCHSLPNYQVASAIDMVKALVDNFPDDFPRRPRRAKRPGALTKVSSHKH